MKLQVVTFDLDNTLWDVDSVIREAEHDTRQWMVQRAPDVARLMASERWRTMREQVLAAEPRFAHDITALRIAVLREAAVGCGYCDREAGRIARDAFEVFIEARHRVVLFDGARDLLEHLARRYCIGALSNGNADVHRLGMNDVFSFKFSAADVGARKPAPEMFRAALAQARAQASQMIHIGDQPLDDIEGASRLGIPSVWANFTGADFPPDYRRPTFTVTRLADIPAKLREYDERG